MGMIYYNNDLIPPQAGFNHLTRSALGELIIFIFSTAVSTISLLPPSDYSLYEKFP